MDAESIAQLRKLGDLINSSIETVIKLNGATKGDMPAKPLFDAQRALLAASGKLTELISQPSVRIMEVSSQYFEARCLHIVVDKRIPDILARAGKAGVHVEEISRIVGIEARKLSRVLRCLCSIHIFQQVGHDTFANNRISAALVDNEPLRAYILLFGLDLYSASDQLPRFLNDPVLGSSYKVEETAFQAAANTSKPRWEWLEEKTTVKKLRDGDCGSDGAPSAYPGPFGAELDKAIAGKADDEVVPRPEHAVFGLAMLGGGRSPRKDYPWDRLGSATVVDVGGGVGGFCLQLSHLYPDLKFVVQDRAPVLQQAETFVWPKENPTALSQGRVTFTPHDFFSDNPVKGAEVYWLRYIIHDWSDEYCVKILSAIRASMGPKSRILICDQVMNTTLGTPELPPAPSPLPANWGYYTRYSHQRDLAMMSIINGIERTPAEFRSIVEKAGLKLRKIWDCRSQVSLVEVVLPDSELLSSELNGSMPKTVV
ncbi:O-methyltransferase A [Westerdykella ornata]|uniref:O-methyltransferase A n=1 Tax=Westerdykella ornata TaxID=318751 RepID=A0A6A6JU32_WESOR|nr:O-methyltransferase A [Westerdykella ornata]KAF2280130.1 O-methyltransferase A [Westerdykella ornata]